MEGDTLYSETVLDTVSAGVGGPDVQAGLDRAEWTAKRLVLAGIGAAATVLDTADDQFDRFVDRGQRVQEEWRDRTHDVRRRNLGSRSRARQTFESVMDVFLDTLNVPSKADVDTINVKLNILMRKLDNAQTPPDAPAASTSTVPTETFESDLAT